MVKNPYRRAAVTTLGTPIDCAALNAGTFSELPSASRIETFPTKPRFVFVGENVVPFASWKVTGLSSRMVPGLQPKRSKVLMYTNGLNEDPGEFKDIRLSLLPSMSSR